MPDVSPHPPDGSPPPPPARLPGAAPSTTGTYALYTPVLRSSHLERLAPLPGFRLLATSRHPDCDPELLSAAAFPVRLAGLAELEQDLRDDPPDVLEVTEPLWTAEWPASLRLADAAPSAVLVTYAIEVLSREAPPETSRLAAVAFGSLAAQQAYALSCPDATWVSRVVEERRGRCACLGPDDDLPAAREVVLAAELSERKGIDLLMAAWDAAAPLGWRLRLLGWGPRTEQVLAWATGRADVDVVVRADRATVHAALARAAAVVLPSRRVDGWREQIGLSVVEGLSHGCHVLTTSETGLADGLRRGGHTVVAAGSAAALADGLSALGSLPARKTVPSPGDDSRQQVQRWLAGRAAAPVPSA